MTDSIPQPPVVSRKEWENGRAELLLQKKELTKAGDRVSAARRRLPMTPMDKYASTDPPGRSRYESCSATGDS